MFNMLNIDSQALNKVVKEWLAAFVIQMDGVTEVRANIDTHPEFGEALEEAKAAGVSILPLPCHVEPDGLEIVRGGFDEFVRRS